MGAVSLIDLLDNIELDHFFEERFKGVLHHAFGRCTCAAMLFCKCLESNIACAGVFTWGYSHC